jgi:Rod binding domain-containing protein
MTSIQSALLSQPMTSVESTAPGRISSKSDLPIPAHNPAKVAKDFEAVFSSMMLKEMRNTLEPGSLFGEDSSDILGGLFDQFLGQHLADSGGFGMAKMIEASLNKSM